MARRDSFNDRFAYLDLKGRVGDATFGGNRYLNQRFYSSREWRQFRNAIIERDDGCDLGVRGREIRGRIVIHHIEPITQEMLVKMDPLVLDPENVVCVSYETHQMIHYGTVEGTARDYEPRRPGDTVPWKASA